jgi:hypothetical protein
MSITIFQETFFESIKNYAPYISRRNFPQLTIHINFPGLFYLWHKIPDLAGHYPL